MHGDAQNVLSRHERIEAPIRERAQGHLVHDTDRFASGVRHSGGSGMGRAAIHVPIENLGAVQVNKQAVVDVVGHDEDDIRCPARPVEPGPIV
jgi:hypothetical protein